MARRWKPLARQEAALLWLLFISRENCMWLMLGTAGEQQEKGEVAWDQELGDEQGFQHLT